MATRADVGKAAAMLRRVVDAVHAGDLDAEGREALGLLRRMEGAAVALETAAQRPSRSTRKR